MTGAELDALKREFQQAVCRAYAVPPRILGLKRRTRAHWWLAHRVDGIAIWLCDHHHENAALRLWRITRLW